MNVVFARVFPVFASKHQYLYQTLKTNKMIVVCCLSMSTNDIILHQFPLCTYLVYDFHDFGEIDFQIIDLTYFFNNNI